MIRYIGSVSAKDFNKAKILPGLLDRETFSALPRKGKLALLKIELLLQSVEEYVHFQ